MKGGERNNSNGAPRRLIGCALLFTGGLNFLLALRAGAAPGPVGYLFILAGAALLLYGVRGQTRG